MIDRRFEGCRRHSDRTPPIAKCFPRSCQQVKGAVYFDLGMTKLADFSQQIRDVLSKTEPGSAAAPFMSAAGVELDRTLRQGVVKKQRFVLPTREQVEEQLFSEQISAMARRYTRDLKRNADIEVR